MIIKDDSVCSGQVYAQTTRTGTKQEDENIRPIRESMMYEIMTNARGQTESASPLPYPFGPPTSTNRPGEYTCVGGRSGTLPSDPSFLSSGSISGPCDRRLSTLVTGYPNEQVSQSRKPIVSHLGPALSRVGAGQDLNSRADRKEGLRGVLTRILRTQQVSPGGVRAGRINSEPLKGHPGGFLDGLRTSDSYSTSGSAGPPHRGYTT